MGRATPFVGNRSGGSNTNFSWYFWHIRPAMPLVRDILMTATYSLYSSIPWVDTAREVGRSLSLCKTSGSDGNFTRCWQQKLHVSFLAVLDFNPPLEILVVQVTIGHMHRIPVTAKTERPATLPGHFARWSLSALRVRPSASEDGSSCVSR